MALMTSAPVHAAERLTKSNITAFIQEVSDMTSGDNLVFSQDEILKYLDLHIYEKARFKSTVKYSVPGYPAQSASLSLDKGEYINNIKDGSQALLDYENEVEIKQIRISKDGQKATVQTQSTESGMMPISTEEGNTEHVPIEGQSACNQIISLDEDGVIQMYSAQCSTVMTFQEF